MKWEATVLITFYVLNALLTIGMIGKERKPIEPSTAVGAVVFAALLVWLVLRLGGAQ